MSNWQTNLIQINGFFFKIWLITKKRAYHLFEILFWPIIGLVSVGLLTRSLSLGPEMVAFILIGVIALAVVQIGQLDISYVVLYSVWNKSLKQEMAAPINIFHLIAGAWLMGIVHSAVVLGLLSLFSAYAFGFDFLQPGSGPLVVFFFGLMLTSAVVGMLVCALAFKYGGRSHVAANSIVSILILLSGIYYPIDVLPQWIKFCSYLIPVTYFLEYFRSFYGFTMSCSRPLLIAFSLIIIYIMIASWALSSSLRHSKKSGTMLKMSE